MATKEEMQVKAEHDAWYARMLAEQNAADLDYIAMMTDVELDTEEETDDDSFEEV